MLPPQAGYILHTRPFRETSLLVDVFCQQDGKQSCVLKGARGKSSKNKVQPFCEYWLNLSGNSELKSLHSVESLSQSYGLTGTHLFSGLYINELLQRLLPKHMGHLELFSEYQATLKALNDKDCVEPILRRFELNLLTELGYGIDFYHVGVDGNDEINMNGHYIFHAQRGFDLALEFETSPRIPGSHIFAMSEGRFDDEHVLKSAKWITRQALQPLLGNKPLKSRELFNKPERRT